MHAECTNSMVLFKYFCCAISLVHIKVNDKDLFGELGFE